MTEQYQNLLPLSDLAGIFGYTRDHLAYLCRTNQIQAARAGRSWKASAEQVKNYRRQIEAVQAKRWNEMSFRQNLKLRPIPEAALWTEDSGATLFKILAGGIEQAARNFQTAVWLVFFLPVISAFELTNFALRTVYFVFTWDILIAGRQMLRWYHFSTMPAAALFGRYGKELSLTRIMRAEKRAKMASTAALVLVMGVSFTTAVSAGTGIPPDQLSSKINARTDEAIEAAAGFAQTAFLNARKEFQIEKPQQMSVSPKPPSLLVHDYVQAGMSGRGEIAGAIMQTEAPSFASSVKVFASDFDDFLSDYWRNTIAGVSKILNEAPQAIQAKILGDTLILIIPSNTDLQKMIIVPSD